MLCEVHATGNFMTTWMVLMLLGFLSQLVFSGTVFYKYYGAYCFPLKKGYD